MAKVEWSEEAVVLDGDRYLSVFQMDSYAARVEVEADTYVVVVLPPGARRRSKEEWEAQACTYAADLHSQGLTTGAMPVQDAV